MAGRRRHRSTMTTPGPILVTGSAGFIGFHSARRLLARGAALGCSPSTPIDVGVRRLVDGYRDFYDV